jgi:ribosomal protein L32E
MPRENPDRIERMLLLHLLDHRSQQIRFEASQWTTEFGIFRKFAKEDQTDLKTALRTLEMSRMVYRRTQYVVGYSEPKHVFSLTPSGHRKALEVQREETTSIEASGGTRESATLEEGPMGRFSSHSSSDP